MRRRLGTIAWLSALALGTVGISSASVGPQANTDRERLAFESVPPYRILDTREGQGAPKAPLGPGGSLTVQVTGGPVPADAVAVVMNVTAVNASASSHLTVWPAGSTMPLVSNLNFEAGETIPNLVTVRLGTGGHVSIFNNVGTVHLVADIAGYYHAHDHDDRYYTKAQVDATVDSLGNANSSLAATVSSLGKTNSSLAATVSSLDEANSGLASSVSSLAQAAPEVRSATGSSVVVEPSTTSWVDIDGATVQIPVEQEQARLILRFTASTWCQNAVGRGPLVRILVDSIGVDPGSSGVLFAPSVGVSFGAAQLVTGSGSVERTVDVSAGTHNVKVQLMRSGGGGLQDDAYCRIADSVLTVERFAIAP